MTEKTILNYPSFWVFIAITIIGISVISYALIVHGPEMKERHDENLSYIKSLECLQLKQEIYDKSIPRLSDAKHEYEWRCEK